MPLPQIQEKLFADIVSFYGRLFNLSPLSAKIYAYLAFDFARHGVCFDALMKATNTSKSSVSNSLKMLEKSRLVTYTFKLNSRQRLYTLNADYLLTRFSTLVQNMEKEKSIIKGLMAAMKKNKSDNPALNKVFVLYIQSLDNNVLLLQQTTKALKAVK